MLRRVLLAATLIAMTGTGCPDAEPPGSSTGDINANVDTQVVADVPAAETTGPQLNQDFGDPCAENQDCDSGN